MKVLVTGGTGFVGSHSVRALVEAGHSVRLLVRRPDRIAPALAPLGVDGVEHAVGDVTDRRSVTSALEGCDAVLHGAGVYALSRRQAAEMERVNPAGTEIVLGTAHELGLDPIVHVSSYVAMLPTPPGGSITADTRVGRPAGPYGRSKAASEEIARRLQEAGAPVVITQPGVVWGPHDPHMGETARIAQSVLRAQLPILPGGMPIVDVRDIAAAHVAVMRPGRGPRRLLLVSETLSFAELIDCFRRLTGRRLLVPRIPRALAVATLGRVARVPAAAEGPWFAFQVPCVDGATAEEALGLRFRKAESSIADTVRWLHAEGKVSARRAGRLAGRAELQPATAL